MLILDNYCFICGKENPKGLKLTFESEGGRARCEFTLSSEYQGYKGIVHGGIISAIIDEACAYATLSLGFKATTARINIRFKRPAFVGEKLIVESIAKVLRSKLVEASAEIRNQNGEVVAEGEAKFIIHEEV